MKNHQIKVNKNLCVGCGLCSDICVAHNIDISYINILYLFCCIVNYNKIQEKLYFISYKI